ncbi:hypothetical protein KP509_1Z272300 [Ceratopteris richardii]|nr:hypothetical protein KP509_1Z272300 [Ceratopteris richardii]
METSDRAAPPRTILSLRCSFPQRRAQHSRDWHAPHGPCYQRHAYSSSQPTFHGSRFLPKVFHDIHSGCNYDGHNASTRTSSCPTAFGEQRRSCWLCRFIIPHRLCFPGLRCFRVPLESLSNLHDLPPFSSTPPYPGASSFCKFMSDPHSLDCHNLFIPPLRIFIDTACNTDFIPTQIVVCHRFTLNKRPSIDLFLQFFQKSF